MFSSYEINVPQLDVDLDRTKAKQQGVAITDVFDTMQIYLGSLYVNDFNRFGRVFQVRAQADAPFRAHAEDIGQLEDAQCRGEMVPLSSLVTVSQSYGPEMVVRYNGYTAADINGGPRPGYSSSQAEAAIERVADEVLPPGVRSNGQTSPIRRFSSATPASGCSRSACCSSSWCWRRSTKA